MDELSLYILDITMNSVRAGAENISITLVEEGEWLTFTVSDDGCGMTKEQVERLTDPFFTTRKTRKVGLGIPFLTMLAEMTGGGVSITSTHMSESENHGTTTKAKFCKDHIDFIPLGDIAETVVTLVQGSPNVNFTFLHKNEKGEVQFSSEEIRAILGNDISLAEPEILSWIGENIKDQYSLIS